MDVVLHVGAHRTASTTFQKTLGANGTALADAGVAYWGPKCTRAGLFDGLIGRPDAIAAGDRARALARVARRARQVERGGARILIVSEENALGSMRAALGGLGFYPDAGARVAALAAAFADHRLRIAMAVRGQAAWWPSAVAFLAARDGERRTFADADALALQPRGWRDVIGDIAAETGRAPLAVWSHEAMAGRPDAVIARLGGVGLALTPLVGRRNAGGPPAAALDPATAVELGRRYRDDLAWLRAGADGIAQFIEAGPGDDDPAATGQERG